MKYIANPVVVDAFRIVGVGQPDDEGDVRLELEDGSVVTADAGKTARFTPSVGDYWVIQSDGYIYLNPKAVFERKYSPDHAHIAATHKVPGNEPGKMV